MRNRDLLIVTQVIDEQDAVLGFFCGWVRAWAEAFPERKLHVWAWKVGSYSFPANVSVYQAPDSWVGRAIKLFVYSWRHRQALGAVFVHMIPLPAVLLGLWWKLLGFRIGLWYTHGMVSMTLRLAGWFTDHIFTASAESCRLNTSKKRIVGHGIDVERFVPHTAIPRMPTILTVGRISPRKGLTEALDIIAQLAEQPSQAFQYILVGEPRTADDEVYALSLRKKVEKLRLQDRVVWAGAQIGDEVVRTFQSAAVLLTTSKTGSVDKVVLEALACGTRVVALSEVYQAYPGVCGVSSEEEAVAELSVCLRHPSVNLEAAQYIRTVADQRVLIRRMDKALFAHDANMAFNAKT